MSMHCLPHIILAQLVLVVAFGDSETEMLLKLIKMQAETGRHFKMESSKMID